MTGNGRNRVVIENLQPALNDGRFPIKRVTGEAVTVTADLFADGHETVAARLLYRPPGQTEWLELPMQRMENDRWRGAFVTNEIGVYQYTVEGWVDHFSTWQEDLQKKFAAGQDIAVELLSGAEHLERAASLACDEDARRLTELAKGLREPAGFEQAVRLATAAEVTELMRRYPADRQLAGRYRKELKVVVDRRKALFSTWYERFPRSCAAAPGRSGTLKDCRRLLPEIARMGFDVFYLPPIHPIGETHRKGKNNASQSTADDPGSCWAIGSAAGGHKAVHPQLGTLQDFDDLVAAAAEHGIEIALDFACQCSPDHPYVKEHPEWFRKRPDGSIQYAENPPKKYQDIYPLNFETEHWRELWEELRGVVQFWIDRGVRIFRVDNPHTKPFAFWEWLITEVKRDYPETIFLAEAFTRPKVMNRLAKLGFSQSYTYFTWRNSKQELTDFVTQLTGTERRDYFNPNFWPNTPDILPEYLQYGGRPAFIIRLVLAATLASSYGIYGPAFELCVDQALPGREEYLDSEKYEIRTWNWDQPGHLKDFIARVNAIRRAHPVLQSTWNVRFHEVDNDYLLFYVKESEELAESILVVVNLDPFHTQSGWLTIPIDEFGIGPDQPYLCHDLLSDEKYIWQGEKNYVELNPQVLPAYIFKLRKRLKRETDFDYFM